ncbi:MAG: hypothetical protein JO072_12635 [Parafilimonas sp.]|nr:hypothetical protein [Parafilimonas sp.]
MNSSDCWQQSNFHAHSCAWNGITNGKQSACDMIDLYKQKGYAYASISNYEKIALQDAQPNSVEVYEHGYNIFKIHQLVIMPKKVCYNDFPLFQFASSKQFMINKLNYDAEAVVLAHPKIRNGYSDEDLKKLSGYNLMEVLNHAGNACNKWDVALSAGKPVWIVGDDDTHDVLDTNQTFRNWTMVNCKQKNKDSLIKSLIGGSAYAVNGSDAKNDNKLVGVKTKGLTIEVRLQTKADSIQLIGQNGIVRKTFVNTNEAFYNFKNNDTYIRTVIYNKASVMYLNPVLRYNGITRPQNNSTAAINFYETIFYRSGLLVLWLVLSLSFNIINVSSIIKLIRNKRGLRRKAAELGLNI